jgi:hypothetical protein
MPSPRIPNPPSQSLSLLSVYLLPPSVVCLLLWWTDGVQLVAVSSPSLEHVGQWWIHPRAPLGRTDPAPVSCTYLSQLRSPAPVRPRSSWCRPIWSRPCPTHPAAGSRAFSTRAHQHGKVCMPPPPSRTTRDIPFGLLALPVLPPSSRPRQLDPRTAGRGPRGGSEAGRDRDFPFDLLALSVLPPSSRPRQLDPRTTGQGPRGNSGAGRGRDFPFSLLALPVLPPPSRPRQLDPQTAGRGPRGGSGAGRGRGATAAPVPAGPMMLAVEF